MKKLLTGFIFSLLAFAIWTNISFAQSTEPQIVKTMLVATVNIYDATNTKINNNTYNISFRLKNKTGIQPDIRYGVQLIKKSTGEVVDMDLSNEAITLGEGESKTINTTYTIPSYIPNGVYKINIVSQNASGIRLSSSPIGFPEKLITIDNDANGININNCYLTIPTDATSTKYNINQGIDIFSNEELYATCEITNNAILGNSDLKLQLITHNRDQYGDILDNKILDQKFSIKGNTTDNITFKIPSLSNPQAYDIDTFFINEKGEKISPSIYIHYVISGNSATIQNTFLDKNNYKLGETAFVEVFWTPSADSFPFSRHGGTGDNYVLNTKVTDSFGEICGKSSKKLTKGYDLNSTIASVAINKDCNNAIASINIVDSQGNILANQTIDLNSRVDKVNINPNIPKAKIGNMNINKFYIVLFVIILVLIGYGILVFRKKDKNI